MNEEWTGLNLPQLIDLLEPVPAPDPVSMGPQTVGWIWLGLAILAALALAAWRVHQWRRRNAYRRAALAELATCPEEPGPLAELVRRTALTAYPRDKVAALRGGAWLAFLDSTYDGEAFRNGPGQCLADGPYRRPSSASGLKPLVRDWIRTHRREAG